jgi:hypothetical protein
MMFAEYMGLSGKNAEFSCKALQLPYGDGQMSMVFMLSNDKGNSIGIDFLSTSMVVVPSSFATFFVHLNICFVTSITYIYTLTVCQMTKAALKY